MTEPKRIQRKRTKGWRMPEGAVYVGRPGKYGNLYKVSELTDGRFIVIFEYEPGQWERVTPIGREYATYTEAAKVAVSLYRTIVYHLDLKPLRGHDLACFCKEGEPCHADILLELANR